MEYIIKIFIGIMLLLTALFIATVSYTLVMRHKYNAIQNKKIDKYGIYEAITQGYPFLISSIIEDFHGYMILIYIIILVLAVAYQIGNYLSNILY